MHADHAMITGRPHQRAGEPGQDYALSGITGAVGWAVVCDGCSTGGPLTDVGARLWAVAAARVLPALGVEAEPEEFRAALIDAMAQPRNWLGLENLLATVACVVSDGRHARVSILGDGAFAVMRPDGSFDLHYVGYSGNAPDFPAYAFEKALREVWVGRYGGVRSEQVWRVNGSSIEPQAGGDPTSLSWRFDLSGGDISGIAVFTDGIGSLRNVSPPAAAAELLMFKTVRGNFVKRRLARAAADWAQAGSAPGDDLSIAALWLASEPDAPTS